MGEHEYALGGHVNHYELLRFVTKCKKLVSIFIVRIVTNRTYLHRKNPKRPEKKGRPFRSGGSDPEQGV